MMIMMMIIIMIIMQMQRVATLRSTGRASSELIRWSDGLTVSGRLSDSSFWSMIIANSASQNSSTIFKLSCIYPTLRIRKLSRIYPTLRVRDRRR